VVCSGIVEIWLLLGLNFLLIMGKSVGVIHLGAVQPQRLTAIAILG
jgi:hypothetical protein